MLSGYVLESNIHIYFACLTSEHFQFSIFFFHEKLKTFFKEKKSNAEVRASALQSCEKLTKMTLSYK